MILGMKFWTENLQPRIRRYQSIREYLRHGPPIYLDYSEIRTNRWVEYERAVKDLLQNPKTSSWLDGPLDHNWSKSLYQQSDEQGLKAALTTSTSRAIRRRDRIAIGGGILFWISHVTAALGFVLIANTSGPDSRRMAEM